MAATRVVVVSLVGLAAAVPAAHAEGEVTLRGAYYKERATRVMQPMLDATFAVGEEGRIDAHGLVDAITSASAATGADGTPFTERRYEVGGGYTRTRGRWQLGASMRVSTEPDYDSIFSLVRARVGLLEDNVLIGAALGYGADRLSNEGAQGPFAEPIEGSIGSTLASLSITQVLSQTAVASVTYDVNHQRGFLANPYRTVVAIGGTAAERHPDTRWRHAVAASARTYVRATRSTWIASYRLYLDDWGVLAHTPEIRWLQAAGDTVEFGARYRLHAQGAADFYQEMYEVTAPEIEPYLTADEKLSRFRTHTFEARLAILGEAFGATGRWGEARFETLLSYVAQNNAFGNAVVGMASMTVPVGDE